MRGEMGRRVPTASPRWQDMFFSKPTGLYVLLDEESHFPRATSDTLVAKLHSNLGKCTYYKQPRGNTPTFGLKHYAGEVEYACDEFLEKNRDSCVGPAHNARTQQRLLTPPFFSTHAHPLSPTGLGGLHVCAGCPTR